jgi:hypothetical protein
VRKRAYVSPRTQGRRKIIRQHVGRAYGHKIPNRSLPNRPITQSDCPRNQNRNPGSKSTPRNTLVSPSPGSFPTTPPSIVPIQPNYPSTWVLLFSSSSPLRSTLLTSFPAPAQRRAIDPALPVSFLLLLLPLPVLPFSSRSLRLLFPVAKKRRCPPDKGCPPQAFKRGLPTDVPTRAARRGFALAIVPPGDPLRHKGLPDIGS